MIEIDVIDRSLQKKTSGLAASASSDLYLEFRPRTSKIFFKLLNRKIKETYALYSQLVGIVKDIRHFVHETEWILDNFYILEGAVSDIVSSLRDYRKEFGFIPYITKREGSKGFISHPRIYYIVSELLKVTNNKIDKQTLQFFINEYQKKAPLSVRELAFMPTVLRILLIENAQDLIKQSISSFNEFAEAKSWLSKVGKQIAKKKNPDFSYLLSQLSSIYPLVPINFGFYLHQHIGNYGSAARPILRWLKLNLAKRGINVKDLAETESKERNANSIFIANIINSLRWLNQSRWDDFVDEVNSVDRILKKDPAGVYGLMESKSQDLYRRAIMRMADKTGIYESEISKTAIAIARSASKNKKPESSDIFSHVGYYIIDEGRQILESKIGYKPSFYQRLYRFSVKHPNLVYFGLLLISTTVLTWLALYMLPASLDLSIVLLAGFLFVILNTDISVNLVNVCLSKVLPVKLLPKIDLIANAVPDGSRTFVVIPSVFRNKNIIANLTRKLEVHYLGNEDKNILWGVLLDFKDSRTETGKEDGDFMRLMDKAVANLNLKYGGSKTPIFFAFYRKRIWNEREQIFMAWERKRGMLREFNKFLLGDTEITYISKRKINLPHIKYVITLDDDTELPRDAAKRLIGCISHPLNSPVLHKERGVVERGYGIIQPQITTRINAAGQSWFAKLFAFSVGLDSYSRPTPDIYQDLFGKSIFFGKGIYDIESVEGTMRDNIPENTLLSHDLIEGLYARAGLSSDIQMFDGFPQNYHEYLVRLHRWIRGDWQIIKWLNPFVQRRDISHRNNFGLSDKWKIIDNLRRSLIPTSAFIFIILIWIFSLPAFWNIYPILILGAPFIIWSGLEIIGYFKTFTFMDAGRMVLRRLVATIIQIATRISLLFYQTAVYTDAISKALFRLFFTKRKLLQWTASQEIAKHDRKSVFRFYKVMWFVPLLSLIAFGIFYVFDFGGMYPYAWLSMWFTSPLVVYVLSLPRFRRVKIGRTAKNMLRRLAYRNFRFFSELSDSSNNWLIPDHVQEYPKIARTDYRVTTSPTNIGALLTSLIAGYDFGYIGLHGLIHHIKRVFASLSNLEKFSGHFYNWYDIKTLKPLFPKYVSSVDSANLLASLLVLKQALGKLGDDPILSDRARLGLMDILGVLREELKKVLASSGLPRDIYKIIHKIIERTDTTYKTFHDHGEIKTTSAFINILDIASAFNKDLKVLIGDIQFREGEELFIDCEKVIKNFEDAVTNYSQEFNLLVPFYSVFTNIPIRKDSGALKDFYEVVGSIVDSIPTIDGLSSGSAGSILKSLNLNELMASGLARSEVLILQSWVSDIYKAFEEARFHISGIKKDFENISSWCEDIFEKTDFRFLYNKERGLFHIGYNASFNKIDNAYYDFIASEASLISFIAIAKNDVPQKHWFHLGRKLVRVGDRGVMLSWGGSLFEYLTSLLFLKVHQESLLGESARIAIKAHRRYARRLRIPWGMGEAAYNSFDASQNYQYQIFGVPTLGLKRGLKDYAVVAPYTSALALPIKPKAAISNIKKLIRQKLLGGYGFYDSVDYTGLAILGARRGAPSKIYYAHHQGFTISGINNLINHDRIIDLFQEDPRVEAGATLLEEGAPKTIPLRPVRNISIVSKDKIPDLSIVRKYIPVKTAVPRYAFLSNGNYSVVISNSGSGYSKYQDVQLSRFREDPVLEPWGTFFYIKDIKNNEVWSPTLQPTKIYGRKNKIIFSENKAEFRQSYNDIETNLSVTVPSIDNVEIRELALTNSGDKVKTLEVSSLGEISLTKASLDKDHPMFHKLMVESEFIKKERALVFSRRHYGDRSRKVYFAHSVLLPRQASLIGHTRSREEILGRNGSMVAPKFVNTSDIKEDTMPRHTLDSGFGLKVSVAIKPNETIKLSFISGAGGTREEVIRMIKKYNNRFTLRRALYNSDEFSLSNLRDIGISTSQGSLFQELASKVLNARIQKIPEVISGRHSIIESLWRHGISGDFPLFIARVKDIEDAPLVKQMLSFYKYMKYKGIDIDVVILNEYPSSYIRTLDDEIDFMIRSSRVTKEDVSGPSVFHLKSDLISLTDKEVLFYIARLLIDSKGGALERQIASYNSSPKILFGERYNTPKSLSRKDAKMDHLELSFNNGFGGFDKNNDYSIIVKGGETTPSSWVNIIANDSFGFLMSESGSTFTWSEDSYDNRLTAFYRDDLIYGSGEIIYIKDEVSDELWTATPQPTGGGHPYRVTHGRGFSSFEHKRGDIYHKLLSYVVSEERLKISKLYIKNSGVKARRISVTSFSEMVLGSNREDTRRFLNIYRDRNTGSVFVENKLRTHFKNRIVYLDMNGGDFTSIFNREDFLGRHGSISSPAALSADTIESLRSGPNGGYIDNCVVMQSHIVLRPQEERELTIFIGEEEDQEVIRNSLAKYRISENADKALKESMNYWTLNNIIIDCPDKSLNILFNNWLTYQILSSRLFGKTGYYQSSGAYGFRDQLQDLMALLYNHPALARDMILKAASHQFKEGDAQNWWHDHNGFGIRTAFSDHQLWLPYLVHSYISITGDKEILDEQMPFLDGPKVNFAYRPEWTGVPDAKTEKYSLYEHCVRAIDHTLKFGPHGLPLFGMSDWNDSMNMTGSQGRGESVWLGWFLYAVLSRFSNISETRKDHKHKEHYKGMMFSLRTALESSAWDGSWYKRAFMDNGVPLGSSSNKEFKIDSIAQSWSVLSGGGHSERVNKAIESALKNLVDDNAVRLLAPPLQNVIFDPGSIRDYPPGVRENGAQYNHAALWLAQAIFILGDGDTAKRLVDLVNPILRSQKDPMQYRVEPYVLSSEVYSYPSYPGRGGWTWYTGSAGLMYRTILEFIFGVTVSEDVMTINPCIPKNWKDCSLAYKLGRSEYLITINNFNGVNKGVVGTKLDGRELLSNNINLVDDGKKHKVVVTLGFIK